MNPLTTLLCGLLFAASAEVVQQRDGVTLRLESPESRDGTLVVPLSGKLLLSISGEGPPPRMYLPLRLSPEWEVKPGEESPPEAGRWRQRFILDPRGRAGSLTLKLEPLEIGERKIEWAPVPVEVTTEVAHPDLNQARDVRPPEDPPQPPPSHWPVVIVGGVGLTLLVVVLMWAVRRRRMRKSPPLTPNERALRELSRIDALGLPATGDVKRYHTLVSEVVRRYLEMRFDLPASRRTTAEFLQSVQTSGLLADDQRACLRELLDRCDLAKFAPVALTPSECEASGQLCKDFVLMTRPAPAAGRTTPPAVTS